MLSKGNYGYEMQTKSLMTLINYKRVTKHSQSVTSRVSCFPHCKILTDDIFQVRNSLDVRIYIIIQS